MHNHHLCHNINIQGKYSNPQARHLNYDVVIRNLEHRNMEFIIVSVIYKNYLKLIILFQTIQLIAQRPIASIYEKIQTIH